MLCLLYMLSLLGFSLSDHAVAIIGNIRCYK